MQALELIRAGAGSGKTTDLCRAIAEAVSEGLDPARILATTFTNKAAAELKGRIQAKIMKTDPDKTAAQKHADRLDLAAIGTVHSVAHQLLSRYAIEMGLSPRLEVIDEGASVKVLSELLAVIPPASWQKLANYSLSLGIDDLPKQILELLAAKRGNQISDVDFTAQMKSSTTQVCELLTPPGTASFSAPHLELMQLAEQALADINALTNDTTQKTKEACRKLRYLKSKRLPMWGKYLEASRIKAGTRSGADALLDPLRNHASRVREHRHLQEDLGNYSSLLTAETINIGKLYQEYKAERGLVDFTDLEILLLELLSNESLAHSLAADFDLVVVDEFQDTNPLQLAIFQRLRQLAPRNRWVGDPKQAIYGFRGTDPKLVNDVWEHAPGAAHEELPSNYRSQRGLVQLTGALFGEQAQQQPIKDAEPAGVERWLFDSRNKEKDALALACGISKLHQEGIRFGDIVVLERANLALTTLSKALDELGIPYLLESPGLLSTREGAMVLAGLRVVADRCDSLASATLLHLLSDPTAETPVWILERLHALQEAQLNGKSDSKTTRSVPWEGDPRFALLEQIDRRLSSPTSVVQQVIEALRLPSLVPSWGDPARRCSHLDSLLQHAREYEEVAFSGGMSATLSGLILYLEKLAAEEKDLRYPPLGHDAVTLLTYHRAKGLEWPVVVLSGLDSSRDPDMWSPAVTGGGSTKTSPLEGRTLRSWTWPFGKTDGQFGGQRTGSGLEDDALATPEGIDRSARENQENLRLLYVGCTRTKRKLVFAHRQGKYAWLAQLPTIDQILDCSLGEGEHPLDGIDTTLIIRKLDAEMVDSCRIPNANTTRWLAASSIQQPVDLLPRFHSPSHAPPTGEQNELCLVKLSESGSFYSSGVKKEQYSAVGDAVHCYLAALPSLQSVDESDKILTAERCLVAFGVTGVFSPTVLVSAGQRFCEWVEQSYPQAQLHVEVPASGPRLAGGTWHGTMDLLLQLPSGAVVLIDHKSAPIQQAQCLIKAEQYLGQLSAYRELLLGSGETIDSTWIHFPLAGVMVQCQR